MEYIEYQDINRDELFLIEEIFIECMLPSLNQASISYTVAQDRIQEVLY